MSYNIYIRGADQSYKYIPPVRHNIYLFYFNDYKVIQIPYHLQLPKVLIIFPNFTDTICYDDACHLKKFTQNPKRNQLTSTAKKMSQMVMVCDKFHFKNHKDTWCKRNCSPYTCASLQVRFLLIQYHDYFNLLYRHDCFTAKHTAR